MRKMQQLEYLAHWGECTSYIILWMPVDLAISLPCHWLILRPFALRRYLAPEYAENGIVSVRTDVFAYGIVLIQLMSGRRAVDSSREDQKQSLRHWVCAMTCNHHS